MLKAVTKKEEIAQCQRVVVDTFKNSLPNHERLTIGHPGGNFRNTVYYGDDIWFSTQRLDQHDIPVPRHWNGFGLGKREDGNQIIVVEINYPLEGSTKQVSGVFAKDEQTNTYLILHRGRIGGGRKGIGKEAFRAWYSGVKVNYYDDNGEVDDAILVGTLGSDGLIEQIKYFVREVAKFKEEATLGRSSRSPETIDKVLTFNPEFYGKKKGKRPSQFEYDSYHGLVVNALEQRLEALKVIRHGSFFNTQYIDLGIQSNGHTRHIYEVKSSADRQSIYSGVGQLMFHSLGRPEVGKTLVLPRRETSKELVDTLVRVGIKVIEYEIQVGQVTFMS